MNRVKVMNIMPEFNLAGAEVMATNLMLAYEINKIEPVCVSFYNVTTTLTERLEKKGIKVFYLGKKQGFDIKMLIHLFQLIKKEKPDVIHTHRYSLIYTLIPSLVCNTKVKIHTIHSQAEYEITKKGQWIYKYAFTKCHVMPVALSKAIKESVEKLYDVNSPIVENGIETNLFQAKKEYNYHKPIKFVHVGRFTYAKNHQIVLDAFFRIFEKNPQSELHLFGNGELYKDIKEQIRTRKLSGNVFLYGLRDDINRLLPCFDVFLLPSRWEGLPMTLLEAMACGLPVVVANVGGIPDIVKDNYNGLIIDSEDLEGLISAMQLLIDNRSLCEKFGRNALITSKEYDCSIMAEKYERLYFSQLKMGDLQKDGPYAI